jgi:hypothetical protein
MCVRCEQELYEYIHDPQHKQPRPLTSQMLKGLRPQKLPIGEVKNIIYQVGLLTDVRHPHLS